ncbi:polyketide synthase dehydratase-domain-containing protein [Xylariomycetidae sp. FL2044]|nr:polyketide synthase dehydratase-domain-containing protein [Xylariomycetidae sp. FL2044]
MKIAFFRGLLASELCRQSGGGFGMMSVGLSADEVLEEISSLRAENNELPQHNAGSPIIGESITISCLNSPRNVTVSGPVSALDELLARLNKKAIFARKLRVSVGYHSPQMELVASRYRNYLTDLRPGPKLEAHSVHMVSTVVPGLVDAEVVRTAEYWVQNMVSPVQFANAMDICCQSNDESVIKKVDRSHLQEIVTHAWIEVGPHAALKGPLHVIFNKFKRQGLMYASVMLRGRDAQQTVLDAMGKAFCHSFKVSLAKLSQLGWSSKREPRLLVDLPKYAFNHSTVYWEESSRSKAFRTRAHGDHPLLGSPVMDWNPLDARWRFIICKDAIPWISDHRLHGAIWYPAAGMITMAIEAAKQLLLSRDRGSGSYSLELRDVSFTAPIVVADDPGGTETQISMCPSPHARGKDAKYKFRIYLRKSDESWDEVCNGSIVAYRWTADETFDCPRNMFSQKEEEHKQQTARDAYWEAVQVCKGFLESEEMYQEVGESTGLLYGSEFQPLADISYKPSHNDEAPEAGEIGVAHARLLPPSDAAMGNSSPYTIHPATLDGIFQLAIPALSRGFSKPSGTLVPARLTRLWISHHLCHVSSSSSSSLSLWPKVAHAQAKFLGQRDAVASMRVLGDKEITRDTRSRTAGMQGGIDTQLSMLIEVDELELTEVAGEDQGAASSDRDGDAKALCHKLIWKSSTICTLKNNAYLHLNFTL